jgi:hypothetical protein
MTVSRTSSSPSPRWSRTPSSTETPRPSWPVGRGRRDRLARSTTRVGAWTTRWPATCHPAATSPPGHGPVGRPAARHRLRPERHRGPVHDRPLSSGPRLICLAAECIQYLLLDRRDRRRDPGCAPSTRDHPRTSYVNADRWPPARPWPTRDWPARPWPAETEGYAPRIKRYRPSLSLRPPRRFPTTRRESRDRWIA